ncbi:hypothetical protein KI688_002798 [Linnemannia hyalina]|uniref:Uncharacterized protein n=1 Tax=Linnemannia hyalina TaxID=64524 RepID=A0A9P8BQL9_9FUNG|nr:hypothetical protein KI688_002798 [Linnemannia hyalina]
MVKSLLVMVHNKISDLDETEVPDHFSQASTSSDTSMPTTAAVVSSSGRSPAAEPVTSSSDQPSVAAEPESNDSSDVDENEKADLLANIEQACHKECEVSIPGNDDYVV